MNSNIIKGFYVMNRAHYANPGETPEIVIGLYHAENGGTEGEFAIRWHDLARPRAPTARLEIFADGWKAFFAMPELLRLAELPGTLPDQDEIITLLTEAGFRDLTPYDPRNKNCLDGMACPQCRSHGPFQISATALFTMTDDGSDAFGDIAYDGGSYCRCVACGHDGFVHDFRTGGDE